MRTCVTWNLWQQGFIYYNSLLTILISSIPRANKDLWSPQNRQVDILQYVKWSAVTLEYNTNNKEYKISKIMSSIYKCINYLFSVLMLWETAGSMNQRRFISCHKLLVFSYGEYWLLVCVLPLFEVNIKQSWDLEILRVGLLGNFQSLIILI